MWQSVTNWLRRLVTLALAGVSFWTAFKIIMVHVGADAAVAYTVPGLDLTFPWTPDLMPAVGVGISGGALGLALLGLAFSGLRRPERRFRLRLHSDRVDRARGGVTVSESGLLKLLAWAAEDIEGINGVDPTLNLGKGGWQVRCIVSVWHDKPLTEVSDALRAALRQALERHTGVQVDRIDVDVQHHPIHATGRVA